MHGDTEWAFKKIDSYLNELCRIHKEEALEVDRSDPNNFPHPMRRLTWRRGEMDLMISIDPCYYDFPSFTGWNLSAHCYIDKPVKGRLINRYYTGKTYLDNVSTETLIGSFKEHLAQAFDYLNTIKKEDVPYALRLNLD